MALAPQMSAPESTQTISPGLSPCTIKVIGVGGGGGNTINRMVEVSIRFLESHQQLQQSSSPLFRCVGDTACSHPLLNSATDLATTCLCGSGYQALNVLLS